MIKIIGHTALGFIIGALVVFGFYFFANKAEAPTPLSEAPVQTGSEGASDTPPLIDMPEVAPSAVAAEYVTVHNQGAGDHVLVAHVQTDNDGWIVVHEENNGVISNALGAARLNAGVHEAVSVPLLRNTTPEQRYWVVLYIDNGDRAFSLATDTPTFDEAGEPIMVPFVTK